jgi:hypothetical protein
MNLSVSSKDKEMARNNNADCPSGEARLLQQPNRLAAQNSKKGPKQARVIFASPRFGRKMTLDLVVTLAR